MQILIFSLLLRHGIQHNVCSRSRIWLIQCNTLSVIFFVATWGTLDFLLYPKSRPFLLLLSCFFSFFKKKPSIVRINTKQVSLFESKLRKWFHPFISWWCDYAACIRCSTAACEMGNISWRWETCHQSRQHLKSKAVILLQNSHPYKGGKGDRKFCQGKVAAGRKQNDLPGFWLPTASFLSSLLSLK